MKRISMWSGPRNVSTAIMYSFAQRPDSRVVDEPLYGYYLSRMPVDHPGKMELLTQLETNPETIIETIINGDADREIIFYKNMAHHLVDLEMNFLKNLSNIILVRDPKDVLISLSKTLKDINLLDTGFEYQFRIFNWLKNHGQNPVIIDSRDLLHNPIQILNSLCDALGIPYYESMLKWPQGGIPEDGPWAKYWYHNVHKSTGFGEYHHSDEKLPGEMKELHSRCMSFYEILKENKLSLL